MVHALRPLKLISFVEYLFSSEIRQLHGEVKLQSNFDDAMCHSLICRSILVLMT